MLFYPRPTSVSAPAAEFYLGCQGECFFVKTVPLRTCALRLRTVAPEVARSRTRDPQGRQSAAKKLTFRKPGAPISVKIRDIVAPCENMSIYYVLLTL